MIERIYVDNFQCLVNFELSLDPINLFLGSNGSGKTSVFMVLLKIQWLLYSGRVQDSFFTNELTRWHERTTQKFQLQIRGNGGVYEYSLAIEHNKKLDRARIRREFLKFDGQFLYEFDGEEVQVFRDDYSKGPKFPFDHNLSGLTTFQPRDDNKLATWFKQRMQRIYIVKLNPFYMPAQSASEDRRPVPDFGNFASWYRYLLQEYPGRVSKLWKALRVVLPGFDIFRIAETGPRHRDLIAVFRQENGSGPTMEYSFNELSEGQRALISLYTLLHCVLSEQDTEEATLCIDEPENFVALPEIQPWLMELHDRCGSGNHQALIISHHPEYIDYLAGSAGWFFDREAEGPVLARRFKDKDNSGLPISELVARGWIDEQT
jgi:predicted ATPase